MEYKTCKDVVQRSDGGIQNVRMWCRGQTVEYKTCKDVVQRSDGGIQNM